jgi:hypothetical protein
MEASGQLHTPVALPQGKSPLYPLYRRLDVPQSWSGHSGEEKNSQPIAQCYTTELFQLHHLSFAINRKGMTFKQKISFISRAVLKLISLTL